MLGAGPRDRVGGSLVFTGQRAPTLLRTRGPCPLAALSPDPCPPPRQMAKLRSLLSSAENEPPVPLVGNWRPPQPIKGRVVRASFK